MSTNHFRLVRKSVYQLLRPLVRLNLEFGIPANEFIQLVKKTYVDIAREEYGVKGRPTNKSRIAAITGLTRHEVLKQINEQSFFDEGSSRPVPLQRVINLWLRETEYLDQEEPKVIQVEGGAPSFMDLVSRCGGDIPYQTMLKELERLEIVAVIDDKVKLMRKGYLPRAGSEEKIPFLGADASSLIDTIAHNILCDEDELPLFQRKVAFPNLNPEGIERLYEYAETKGQQVLIELDNDLAKYEIPEEKGDTELPAMIGLGIYVFNTKRNKESK